jgi:2-keto-4-pentenoate hydratase/2-oxohepta-3-ene-1,7-dioic acid hydratase in catechol pathway
LLTPPVSDTARALCAGLNSATRAEETQQAAPEQPDVLARWRSTLALNGQPAPRGNQLHREDELAMIIAKELRE